MSTYKCSQCGSGDIVTAFTAHVPLKVGDDANEDAAGDAPTNKTGEDDIVGCW